MFEKLMSLVDTLLDVPPIGNSAPVAPREPLISEAHRQLLWENGIWLSAAFLGLQPKQDQERYWELQKYLDQFPAGTFVILQCRAVGAELPEGLDPEKFVMMRDEHRDLKETFGTRIHNAIGQRHLVVLGHYKERRPDGVPQEIPWDVWCAGRNWKTDKVRGNGMEFVAVRLAPYHLLEQLDGAKALPKPPQKSGRPSRSPEIENAYWELYSEGTGIEKMPWKLRFSLIRERVWKNAGEPPGDETKLSDGVIRKYVLPLVKEKAR